MQVVNRREFIGKSAFAVAGITLMPVPLLAGTPYSDLFKMNPVLSTPLNVKFIQNGLLHQKAYEGSCRTGDLKNLTYDSEKRSFESEFDNLIKELKEIAFPDGIALNRTGKANLYVEGGNPEIMLNDDQITQFDADSDKTDVYVICGGGCSQFTAMKIGERYRKPVILTKTGGWGVDFPPSLRIQGLEGYYTQNWEQTIQLLKLMQVRKAIKETSILILTNFPDELPRGVVSKISDFKYLKSQYGIDSVFIDYKDFFGEMDHFQNNPANIEASVEIAKALIKESTENNMKEEDVAKSVIYYMMVENQMKMNKCNAFTTECFELCSSMNPWNRRFTPCLAHALNKDCGYPSACENDINALMAMIVEMYVSKKAVYMGNPDFDISGNTINIHHSVASIRMKGLDAPPMKYGIQSFTESGFGATLRIDFEKDAGQEMTVGRFDPAAKKMLMTVGKVKTGGGLFGCGCAQNVTLDIPDTKKFFRSIQNYGHHLSAVYGNYSDDIHLLADMTGFEVEEV
jgi:hypothetical protein